MILLFHQPLYTVILTTHHPSPHTHHPSPHTSIAPNTQLEIHVEHCANCEGHSTTTKHVPGQYDKAFATLSSAIQDAIGNTFPVEIVSNPNFRPRVGAFEVELIFAAKVPHPSPIGHLIIRTVNHQ